MHMSYHARHPLRMQGRVHVQMMFRPDAGRGATCVLDRRGRDRERIDQRAKSRITRLNLVDELDRENEMDRAYNGVPAGQLSAVQWRKSRRSNPSGNCVELAQLPDGAGVAVRNSRDPFGPALIYTAEEIEAFILGARDGDFDDFVR